MIPEVAQEDSLSPSFGIAVYSHGPRRHPDCGFTTSLIIDVNPFCWNSWVQSRRDLGKSALGFGRFKDRELSKNAFLTLKEKHYIRYEDLPLETKGGIAKAVEIVSNVYGEGDRKVIQCNIRDISERNRQSGRPSSYYSRGNWRPLASSPAAWPMTSTSASNNPWLR